MNFPSCPNTLLPGFSLPEATVMMPSAFQMGAGTPVDRHFSTLPVEESLVRQSSSDATFFMAPNTGPSRVLPPLINYGATRSDFFCERDQIDQSWQANPLAFDFGYGAPQSTEYYPRFSQFNGLSSNL
jgi:hypothetical protein